MERITFGTSQKFSEHTKINKLIRYIQLLGQLKEIVFMYLKHHSVLYISQWLDIG